MKLLDSLQVDGSVTPETNNTRDLGSSSLSWATLYAATDVKVGGFSVWTAGNDGSGSGLDADLLDTHHSSYFVDTATSQTIGGTKTFTARAYVEGLSAFGGSPAITLAIGDTDTGFKWVADGHYQLYANNQSVADITSAGLSITVGKSLTVGADTVWNSGNDGSGSGLDSDLLDNQHGSYYTDIVGRLGYTPINKAGDTNIGALTMSQASVILANNAHVASDDVSTYPLGYSVMWLQNVPSSSGWPFSGYGWVTTFCRGSSGYQDVVQMYTGTSSSAANLPRWFRSERDSNSFWQPFTKVFTGDQGITVGTLDVTGTSTLATLDVTGTSTLAALSVTGNTTISGTLYTANSKIYTDSSYVTFDNYQITNPATYPSPSYGFKWLISTDSAGMWAFERGSDDLEYQFYMSDNPASGDRFVWVNDSYQGVHAGIEGMELHSGANLIVRNSGYFHGNIVLNTPSVNTLLLPDVTNTKSYGVATIIRDNHKNWNYVPPGSTLTLSVDASNYSGSTLQSYVIAILDSSVTPNTFAWKRGASYNLDQSVSTNWTGYGLNISTTPIALDEGVTISFNATTGGVTGEIFGFSVLPGGALKVANPNANNFIDGTLSIHTQSSASAGYVLDVNGSTIIGGMLALSNSSPGIQFPTSSFSSGSQWWWGPNGSGDNILRLTRNSVNDYTWGIQTIGASGNLSVNGSTSLNSLSVAGNTTLLGTLTVNGTNTTINGTLTTINGVLNLFGGLARTGGFNENANWLPNPSGHYGMHRWTGTGWVSTTNAADVFFSYNINSINNSLISDTIYSAGVGNNKVVTISAKIYNGGGGAATTVSYQAYTTTWVTVATITPSAGTSWKLYSATGTVPSGTVGTRVVITPDSLASNTNIAINRIKIEQGALATPFSDEASATILAATGASTVGGTLAISGTTTFSNPLVYTNVSNPQFMDISVSDTSYQEMRFTGATKPSISWVRDASQGNAFKVYNEATPATLFTISDTGYMTINGSATISGALNVSGNTTFSGVNGPLKVIGNSTGVNTDTSYIGFYDSAGNIRTGYVGDGTATDYNLYVTAEQGDLLLNSDTGSVVIPTSTQLTAGTLSVSGTFDLNTAQYTTVTTTVASSALTALYTTALASFQSMKVIITSSITGQDCVRELLVLQDGTNAYLTEYAILSSPSTSELVNDVISADISGANFVLYITAASSTSRAIKLNLTLL